ncbi:hypothetical protein J437_LFUL000444 [Ladona fulva]|uniref:Uncharacterized protein n=1 Tax=Ladona fulva TaxID=123851 RepID=A0A8K0NWU6_LADFU|nr:hypothetical protein J437_LFUL000444 [Ladona fulva]
MKFTVCFFPGFYFVGWRVCSDGEIPSDAFEAGKEDGNSLYVARAYHEGDLIPGKLNPKHGLCYISWGGMEYEKKEYWVRSRKI